MRTAFLSLLLILNIHFSFCQITDNQKAQTIIEQRGEVYFSFIPTTDISIEEITSIISIDKIDANNRIYAYANHQAFLDFSKLRIAFQIEQEAYLLYSPQMAPSVAAFMQNWDSYPTYDQYDSLMHKLASDYPSLCRLHNLGNLPSGRQILALQLGDSVGVYQKEPRFLYTSSMHGNELTAYVLMLRFATYLLSNYGQIPQVDSLMNNVEIWINPLANPDGAYQAGNNSLSAASRYNANFTDLNRNYPDPEDGQHPDGKAWQPETVIFMNFADSMHFTMSANFHGGAEVMNYPWDTWAKLPADNDWWKYVCQQYADSAQTYGWPNYFVGPSAANGSGVVNGYQWYTTYGGRQDYMNYFQQCREVTSEISSVKIPQASSLPAYWNANYRSFLNYINQVRFGLRGFISDSISGSPLSAKVFINSHDKDESHVFSHLPYGDYYRLLDSGYYSITFSADHYYSKTVDSVLIFRDQSRNLDIALVPDYTSLEKVKASSFILFPNPTHYQVHIISRILFQKIALLSLDGKLIKEWEILDTNETTININGIIPGIYLVRIIGKKGSSQYQKLIIQ